MTGSEANSAHYGCRGGPRSRWIDRRDAAVPDGGRRASIFSVFRDVRKKLSGRRLSAAPASHRLNGVIRSLALVRYFQNLHCFLQRGQRIAMVAGLMGGLSFGA